MILTILLLLSIPALWINLHTVENLSNTAPYILVIEHIAVLSISYFMTYFHINKSNKAQCNLYYSAFLLSYIFSLLLLHYLWTPWLEPYSAGWGFDPQRYYIYAQDVVRFGYSDVYLNGMGVVYFYAFIMKFLGVDPLVPLFVNSLLTYLAVLTFIVYLGRNNIKFIKYGWLLVFIPEFIYFNLMPCRDILCMAFMTICVTKLANYSGIQNKIILVISFILLFYIRPTMALPLVMAQICIVFFKRKARITRFLYFLIFFLLIFFMQRMEGVMSSENDSDIQSKIERTTDTDNIESNKANAKTVSLLIPHNPVEYVVFGFIRSFLYVIPTPGMILSPFKALRMTGEGQAPGPPNLTTILLFLSFPMIIKLVLSIKSKNSDIQLFITTTIVYFFVIGTFNPTIIHPRYRVVYDLLYFGLALWQFTSLPKKKRD